MPSTSQLDSIRSLLARADVRLDGGRPWDIRVHDQRFFARALGGGMLGLGESYMDGWWDCDALDELFHRVLSAELDAAARVPWRLKAHLLASRAVNLQTRRRARRVAREHYDLGDDLYMSFLDPYNQYTCAYFRDGDDLDTAQERKLDLICRKLQLAASDRVLDIGCGWGGFARFAAERYGCHVTGVTISAAQAAYARSFCQGLDVEILESDYRDLPRRVEPNAYGKVLICGMIEHVGYRNYRALMEAVAHCLGHDGLFLLHTIGGRRSNTTMDTNRFLAKYIFPDGMMPSLKQLAGAAEGIFAVEDVHNFGPRHYEKTLLAWWRNFERNWPTIRPTYGDRFFRMWRFYMLPTAGGFRAGKQSVWQLVMSRHGRREEYRAVR
jgi:cyclopropane-fatty-acyl-phospholipid synthase